MIVWIPDLCTLTYFVNNIKGFTVLFTLVKGETRVEASKIGCTDFKKMSDY